jgi:putative tricarboxylic transport membrane protein
MTLSFILLILTLALVQGAIVGLMPGLNGIVGVIVLLPFFYNWPVEAILLFFSCYICVTQYFGSVSALLFKVPGEGSSLPVLDVSIQLKRFTSIVKAYRTTALTSLVGALVGIVLFVILFFVFRHHWTQLFSTKFIVGFLSLLLIVLILQNRQYIFNISMLLLGLGLVYFNELPVLNTICDASSWFCFLRSPTEATLILLSVFCVPLFFYRVHNVIPNNSTNGYLPGWRNIFKFWPVGVKHGLFGFFAGFTPGAGLTLASNISNGIEHKRNPHKLLTMAGAAEAANNAAAISCTIPFLFLGLPITPSELVIDNFLATRFYRLNLTTLDTILPIAGYAVSFVALLVTCMLIINIISFLLCGHFIRFWRRFIGIDSRVYLNIVKVIVLASILTVIYTGHITLSAALWTMLVFGGIGVWAMRANRSVIGLVMMMMVGPFIVNKFTLFYNLYF